MNLTTSETVDCNLLLTTAFDVKFLINPLDLPNVSQDYTIVDNLPADIATNIGIAYQTISVTFGTDLSLGIYNITDAVYSTQSYMTHPTNVG